MPPTDEEIQKIVDLHEDGKSQREIAKEFDKSVGWVNGILKRLNVSTERSQTKNANAARREYCAEKRIALIDAGMKRLEEMLPTIDKPSGMRDWFIALATAIDKRRLEDPPKPNEGESDGFLEALETKASDIWKDHAKADTVQVDPIQPEAMAHPDLVEQSKPN
ncbi:helix-turn-helix domain-containing protein [Methanothrix soehngenii]|uniref:helix-turn-helix domain-containing protein n=1 Tax=Methanothrix soehngenii TaxID=2223 RepID=UPI002A3644DA|nr:helix-turn-helix domain-containing protein [Methanothrix soehngenii]MDY0413100.1 helix-turn-helix domain-containing protein [Methanothrix soehngenii]